MRYLFLLLAMVVTFSSVQACWKGIHPSAFAHNCPIIIRGPIVAIARATPGQERADDQASIQVTKVLRNELKDVPLKVGDLLTVRMISRNNRQRSSTDINYPLRTEAVWLVVLTEKNEFRIDRHPVQKQPVQFEPMMQVARQVVHEVGSEGHGTRTRAEWIADQQAREKEGETKSDR